MSENKVKWHPYPKEKPPITDLIFTEYLVTRKSRVNTVVDIDLWVNQGHWNVSYNRSVRAWAELPEPYRPEMKNERDKSVWHPYPDEKPESFLRNYLVTVEPLYDKSTKTNVDIDTWSDSKEGGEWEIFNNGIYFIVTAWAELPEMYYPEAKHDNANGQRS